MKEKKYPKVLIIGETFRRNCGGGITLESLFADWPKENLAVITEKIEESDFKFCKNYYKVSSSRIVRQSVTPDGPIRGNNPASFIRKYRSGRQRIMFALVWLCGAGVFLDRVKVTDNLLNWVAEFNPDTIYVQPLFYRENQLAIDLLKTTDSKLVIHFMDDSFSYPIFSNPVLWILAFYCRRTLRKLISLADVHLAISKEMAEEFRRRYGKKFFIFRNIVDKKVFSQSPRKKETGSYFRIIYTGNLAEMFKEQLSHLSDAILRLSQEGFKVRLFLYSQAVHSSVMGIINQNPDIELMRPIRYAAIPEVLKRSDLMVMLSSLSGSWHTYIKYSFSTRTFEGMFSRVPVLLYASKNCAQYIYAKKTGSAFIVDNANELYQTLKKIITDNNLRTKLAEHAYDVAERDCDSDKIRENFRKVLLG